MFKKIYDYLYLKKIIKFFNRKIIFFILIIASGLVWLLDNYWLIPNLENVNSQRQAIVARKYAKFDNLSNEETIEILLSFAKINSDGLWIDSIKIKENDINLKIRSFDAKNIERYVYEIATQNNLKIINIKTKNTKYKNIQSEKEEEGGKQEEQIPFAVKMYLDSIKDDNIKDSENYDSNNEEGSGKDPVFFAYESEIKLRAHSK